MAIGGLWIPREDKPRLTKTIQSVRRIGGARGEVKWNKTSDRCLGVYKKLADAFFDEPSARYRVIVVDQQKVDVAKHHGGDQELGFYKFYYEMLEKWIQPGNQYLILLDFKQNHGADRYKNLRRVLERKTRGNAWISDLTVIDSREAPIGQVCDLLTGAVAASCCSDLKHGSAKAELAAHIATRVGWASLRDSSLSPAVSKFNVFRIQLQ
jgi:hypothetical protein